MKPSSGLESRINRISLSYSKLRKLGTIEEFSPCIPTIKHADETYMQLHIHYDKLLSITSLTKKDNLEITKIQSDIDKYSKLLSYQLVEIVEDCQTVIDEKVKGYRTEIESIQEDLTKTKNEMLIKNKRNSEHRIGNSDAEYSKLDQVLSQYDTSLKSAADFYEKIKDRPLKTNVFLEFLNYAVRSREEIAKTRYALKIPITPERNDLIAYQINPQT